jgi:hypothetical protein
MAKNDSVSAETFGPTIPAPKVSGGKIAIFGHMINDTVVPTTGFSVNQKTGHPVKGQGK